MSDWTQMAGRTLMVGLPGTHLDAELSERLRRLGPGGVILFGRNLESPRQTIDLLEGLKRLLPHPLLLALDQEGGRVSRLEPWVGPTPTAASLTRAGPEATRRFAAATADALVALGFNLDFAPVVDLCGTAATNGIADRSFGEDPACVAELAGAFLDGLQQRGVAGCLKHFPGLGPTHVDSHEHLPSAHRNRAELERLDIEPYRQLGRRAASVMVSHAHYPALDEEQVRPATLSPVVVNGWLRDRLGYQGLIVSDDLEMGAVAELDGDGQAAVRALGAGCDLVLYCANLDRADRAVQAVARAAESDPPCATRLDRAAAAVNSLARRWPVTSGSPSAWDTACRKLASSAVMPEAAG